MEGNGEKHGTPIFIFSFMHYLSIKIWMKDIQRIVMLKMNADKNMASRKEKSEPVRDAGRWENYIDG